MAKRKSIEIEGFAHKNPIPAACRLGNMLMTGIITGTDPATGKLAGTLEAQCANIFHHVRSIMTAAGGSTDDIIKMNVWMADRGRRDVLNAEWVKMFPDPQSRPVRHTSQTALEGGQLIVCDITAVFAG
jgi:enamine deaminase RidA (YjgF/YER057c/UK114 family)